MIRGLLIVLLAIVAGWHKPVLAIQNDVAGAGSSFASGVILEWAQAFMADVKGRVNVAYKSSNSGDGLRSVTARTVDFAISDIPLTEADLRHDDLVQFPLVIGAVVPIANIPGVAQGQLRLSGQVVADIYMGVIKFWDDPAIRSLNDMSLPHLAIVPFHRADNSGSSYTFTYYLSKSSDQWRKIAGIGSRLKWPEASKAVKGGDAMKHNVLSTSGALGYLEYGQALRAEVLRVSLKNRSGNFVAANVQSIRAATNILTWSRKSYYETIVDLPGQDSWPILAISYGLIHSTKTDDDDIKDTVSFMDWIYHHGASIAKRNDLLPIENTKLIQQIETTWMGLRNGSGRQVWSLSEHP